MIDKPKVQNAPGLTWKPRKRGWAAVWHARPDLIRRLYPIKSRKLGVFTEPPSEIEIADIQSQCTILQQEMLVWAHGGIETVSDFDGTLRTLIQCYQSDKDSPYRKIRYQTRVNYDNRLRRLDNEHGEVMVSEVKARTLKSWHEAWSDDGKKIAAGHGMIAIMRTLFTFGATILDSDDCRKVKMLLHDMRFQMSRPREERLTAAHAIAIRAEAHRQRLPSIALAQALQFECMLRQKDVIGEWVPVEEPGPLSILIDGNRKWIRGLRWNEIDQNLILRHMTSKRQKVIEIDLKNAPMVMEEFNRLGELPADGPVIVSESSKLPYGNINFRNKWRKIATAAGVPVQVRNMDSRAGAISEATDAGAELEHVRHAATHGDISMTQRYSRGSTGKIAQVQFKRSEYRNKTTTQDD